MATTAVKQRTPRRERWHSFKQAAANIPTAFRLVWEAHRGATLAMAALLDRVTHRAHILEFTGESFRLPTLALAALAQCRVSPATGRVGRCVGSGCNGKRGRSRSNELEW